MFRTSRLLANNWARESPPGSPRRRGAAGFGLGRTLSLARAMAGGAGEEAEIADERAPWC